jgi:hypothetical protein
MLQSTIAALEQLLEVQDLSVIEQTERLERELRSRLASSSTPPQRVYTESTGTATAIFATRPVSRYWVLKRTGTSSAKTCTA